MSTTEAIELRILVSAIAAFLILGPGAASAASKPAVGRPGAGFLRWALRADAGEIALGRLAQHRGASPDVRAFGRTLVQDHGRARAQAEDLASVYSVVAPAEPPDVMQTELRRLKALSGRAFDRELVRYSIQTHAQDIHDYRAEAGRRHGSVSRLAEMAVPMLRRHLRMAQALAVATGAQRGDGHERAAAVDGPKTDAETDTQLPN